MTSRDDDMELEALKNALSAATPAPDAARKAENIALSRKNFADLRNSTQGSSAEARHSSDPEEKRGFLQGAIEMIMTRTTAGLTATTAIVAVGLLVWTPTGQEFLNRGVELPPLDEPEVQTESSEESVFIEGDFGTLTMGDTDGPFDWVETEQVLGGYVEPVPVPPVTPSFNNSAVIAQEGSSQLRGYGGAPADGLFLVAPGQPAEIDSEEFANEDPSGLQITAENPVSTFSIDVDTASYALLRSSLNRGQMPTPDAVRIEEMLNYFPYDYPAPEAGDISPFRPTVSVFETPWNPDTQLVHIALQGEMPEIAERPPLNLVFLIDTSGSMNDPTKLPLLVQSFRLMLDRLSPEDQVSIVTYAGSAGVVLRPTPASERDTISQALGRLSAGGSTNGVGGLQQAYQLAEAMSEEGEVSRVILATDGDFNVGISDPDALTDYIAEQRDSGTYLSVLGFGRGNLQDDTMQALAQNGNGTAAYIDTLNEAQRVLVDQLSGALYPIADDVKIQVEFNPAVIAEYRLIGYETRALEREDFNNDAVDAGELGAGHRVTAIYEVTPVGSPARLTDPLRYGAEAEASGDHDGELGFLRLRWKEPGDEESQLIDFPITETGDPAGEALFAASIAGWGELLRGSDFLGEWSYGEAIGLATANRGEDAFGYRHEAIQLMRLSQSLSQN